MSSKSNKSEQAHPIPPSWWPEGNTMLDLYIALGSPKRDSFTQVSDLIPIEMKLRAIEEWPEIRKRACDLFGHEQFEGETLDRLVEWLEEKHGKKWNAARPSSASPHGRPEDDTLGTELAQVLNWLKEAKMQAEGTGAGSDPASACPSPASRSAGPVPKVGAMAQLPHLGDFDFLRSCKLNTEQTEELTALAERWQTLVKRWGVPEAPGAFQVPPEAGVAFHDEYVPLHNALHAFGARHGFIAEPERASPSDPVADVREAIRQHRGIVDIVRHCPGDFQSGVNELWDLWRDRLPEHAPPQRPMAVADHQQAHDAMDMLQRELDRLFPPALSFPTPNPSQTEQHSTMSAECSRPELDPYLLRCIRELREAMRPCLSQKDADAYQHSAGIWYRQLELCLRDLHAGGRNFTGTPPVRRALNDLQTYYDYRNERAESTSEPDAETDARFEKLFRKSLKRLERELQKEEARAPSTSATESHNNFPADPRTIPPTLKTAATDANSDPSAAGREESSSPSPCSRPSVPIDKGRGMSDDQSRQLLADIAALNADAEGFERDVEPITRFTQALTDLEQAAAQYRESGTVAHDAMEQAVNTIDSSYQSAAQFLKRYGIDPKPLLVWVQTKPVEGIAHLRVLIQGAGIAAQDRWEQCKKSISVLMAKAQANAESERAEGAGTSHDPAEGEQAEGTDEQTLHERIASLTPSIRKAYLSFEAALLMAERKDMEDWEAYKLLKEKGIPEDREGQLTDYRLPSEDTWTRYLRQARQALGEQKYTSRRGRPHGKSIVRQDQTELPDYDDR